jgi:hypothetical protein
VELVVEGLGLVAESYGPGGHTARLMRLTVRDVEVRVSRRGGGGEGEAATSQAKGKRKMRVRGGGGRG